MSTTSQPRADGRPDATPAGLTSDEARRRLAAVGPNAVPDTAPRLGRLALAKFWAPVPWMLEAAIVLQLVMGEFLEASVIAVLLVFNAALGFFQEKRAQATLDALKARLALTASVCRDGRWQTIPAAELVPGDIAALSLGSVVAADVRLIGGNVLLDQSLLTGESLPIEAGPGFETFAGALVRRGEAVAEVIATGAQTKFGRTAELVRTSHVVSTQQKAVLRVVRNLALFNGTLVVLQMIYAAAVGLSFGAAARLLLTAVLASIPVALPATFTLASALAARALARRGVLPTRLSAVDEAATMDVLCADKTGTLTRNELAVTAVRAMPGTGEGRVLALAALASSASGADPVDAAVRAAAAVKATPELPLRLVTFVPFDPARKMAEAMAADAAGQEIRIVKGAYAAIAALAAPPSAVQAEAAELEGDGHRVLAVAAGPAGQLTFAGLVALSDPPRPDSAGLIAQLRALGVRTVMITGDSPATAAVVGRAVGLSGATCDRRHIPDRVRPEDFAIFAGVLPEDKHRVVTAFQAGGHTVGMCGDGANDAPALRQAQIGIAVSTATDVAKSAAGIVLTEPGLAGIVASVHEGRIAFQRILTYCLRSLTTKINQMLFLSFGLLLTGRAVLTPLLMVILMITGDFLSMSSTTDNVRPSSRPNSWRIDNLTIAGITFGLCNLMFCGSVLTVGVFGLHLGLPTLRTLAAVTLVFSAQAVFYVVRERGRLWASRPSGWLAASSGLDVLVITTLASRGIAMSPLPLPIIAATLMAAAVFALLLDSVKVGLFRRLDMA
jgi:H+-transporting ATPase